MVNNLEMENGMEHEMRLNPAPFRMIQSGQKTIELRLHDEKRRKIHIGDTIVFTETETGERMRVIVTDLHVFPTFSELYRALPLQKCGYTETELETASPDDMLAYYSLEQQRQYGVVGIGIARL
jgi:ASC-1-like (ASCH) protein